MKIRTRLFKTFLVSTTLLVVVSIGAVTLFANNSLKNSVVGQIEATAASRANHVNNFINERQAEIITLEDNHHIVDYSMEYWKQQNDEIENEWDTLKEGVRLYDHTRSALKAIQRSVDEEVFILNDAGITIVSSDKEAFKKDRSSEKYFTEVKSSSKEGEIYIEDVHRDADGGVFMN
ncbi:hypothetical protein ACFL16_00780, partial [Patescibacteria group bacterium]